MLCGCDVGPVFTNISESQIETQTLIWDSDFGNSYSLNILSLRLRLWRKVCNSESPIDQTQPETQDGRPAQKHKSGVNESCCAVAKDFFLIEATP